MSTWKKLEVVRTEHPDPPAVLFRLSGILTNSPEGYALLDSVQECARHRVRNVVLNLSDLDRITSAGVGIIAASYTSMVNAGGRLALTSIPKPVEMVLNVVRFLTVVEHFETEDAALRHLAAPDPNKPV